MPNRPDLANIGILSTSTKYLDKPVTYNFVIYDKYPDLHIAQVTINRPDVLNALNPAANQELEDVWDNFASDPDLWVAILTGAGDRAFTVGNDLKDRSSESWPPKRGPSGWGGLVTRFDLWKPVIAAVNGYALGGGLEICLACDIIIASENASFGCPEVRIGGVPTNAIHRLLRQIPTKAAMAMMFTGKPIDADEAFRIGLVNEVTAPDQLLERAQEWAVEITKSAPLGVQSIKEVAFKGQGMSIEEAMLQNYESIERVRASQDSKEGRSAFAEKRKPKWQGR
ncbi:MAG: enoyl-CoA hydratase-related protein [Rhodospirillaceae bacterium]